MSRKTEKKRRMSAGRILDTGMTYLILLAVAFVFFFPCLWLILASFSKSGTIYWLNSDKELIYLSTVS